MYVYACLHVCVSLCVCVRTYVCVCKHIPSGKGSMRVFHEKLGRIEIGYPARNLARLEKDSLMRAYNTALWKQHNNSDVSGVYVCVCVCRCVLYDVCMCMWFVCMCVCVCIFVCVCVCMIYWCVLPIAFAIVTCTSDLIHTYTHTHI